MHLRHHVSIVFGRGQPMRTSNLSMCSIFLVSDQGGLLLLVVYVNIQWTRDGEGAQTCINVINNIDNGSIEFKQKLLLFHFFIHPVLTMVAAISLTNCKFYI